MVAKDLLNSRCLTLVSQFRIFFLREELTAQLRAGEYLIQKKEHFLFIM